MFIQFKICTVSFVLQIESTWASLPNSWDAKQGFVANDNLLAITCDEWSGFGMNGYLELSKKFGI
jgi:hypothetical protein